MGRCVHWVFREPNPVLCKPHVSRCALNGICKIISKCRILNVEKMFISLGLENWVLFRAFDWQFLCTVGMQVLCVPVPLTDCIVFHFFLIEILKFWGLKITATGSPLRLLNSYLLSGNSISHSSEKKSLVVDTISGNKINGESVLERLDWINFRGYFWIVIL